MNRFNCTVPYIPGEPDDVCDPNNVNVSHKAYERYNFLSSNGQREICGTPCTSIEVFTGEPDQPYNVSVIVFVQHVFHSSHQSFIVKHQY
jgi:hypothetical protein